MAKPLTGTYPAYFENYVKLVDADSIKDAVGTYGRTVIEFFAAVPADKVEYRYAEGKWSVKELLQHVTDAERIFAYRALCLSRGEKTPLPGFDENSYAAESTAEARAWSSVLEEFISVRKSTDLLLLSFTDKQLANVGTTNGQPNTALAISFLVFGHILHHINIIKDRYL
jgi:uncharacterized damage-inducible protein DinB